MSQVGIIANPESGKDIRRVVAHASTSSNHDKANTILRLLIGLEATGADEVKIMPDAYGISQTAIAKYKKNSSSRLQVSLLDMDVYSEPDDSYQAATLLTKLGVGCIITLGGDGTNRVVADGCGDIPLVPVSTGTNNAFPYMIEGTVAGLAAGVVAKGIVDSQEVAAKRKKIEILKDGEIVDLALIDAVVTDEDHIGSRAVWEVGNIRQILQTTSSVSNIGFSSIGGCLHTLNHGDGMGLHLEIGKGELSVLAPIGPGLIKEVDLKSITAISIGDEVAVSHQPSIIALDGEKNFKVKKGEAVSMRLSADGPMVVDVEKALSAAAKKGFFVVRGLDSLAKL